MNYYLNISKDIYGHVYYSDLVCNLSVCKIDIYTAFKHILAWKIHFSGTGCQPSKGAMRLSLGYISKYKGKEKIRDYNCSVGTFWLA